MGRIGRLRHRIVLLAALTTGRNRFIWRTKTLLYEDMASLSVYPILAGKKMKICKRGLFRFHRILWKTIRNETHSLPIPRVLADPWCEPAVPHVWPMRYGIIIARIYDDVALGDTEQAAHIGMKN